MATISYPHPAVGRQLEKQLQQPRRLHHINYGMLISAALLTLALIALAWCIANCDSSGTLEANPTSGLAGNTRGLNIVTNQEIRPGQMNYVHGDMPVLPVLERSN